MFTSRCLPCAKVTLFLLMIDDYKHKKEDFSYLRFYPSAPCIICKKGVKVLLNTGGLADGLCFNCALDKLCSPPVKSAAFLAAKK